MELINIIKNDIPTLIDKSGELLPFESMTVEEKRVCQNNAKARHIIMCALSEEEMSKVHVMVSAKEMWDTLALTYEDLKEVKEKEEKKKKFFREKKSLMSTWEDLDSSSSDFDEEANICFMAGTVYNSTSEESDEEVDLFDIHYLRETYQETISNNGMIASAYKTMKRNYKNACKEIELIQQEKVSLNDISLKNIELLQEKERLCNENRNLKRDLAVQNANLKNLEKELVLIREKLEKRPIESNETNIDDIITKNIVLRKALSHSNTNEKSLNMLIKSSRKFHDKKGIGCD